MARRTTARAALVVALAGAAAAPAAAQASSSPPQVLATLTTAHEAFPALLTRSAATTIVQARRPITGGPTVLPVIDRASADGARWLRVGLPGRPNGRRAWIRERGTTLTTTPWRIVVETGSRRVLVLHGGRRRRTFSAVVGKPATPTPRGRFFVEESVRMLPGSAGAPFALALSARSNVLQEFEGGPGQIALHGVAGLRGAAGSAVSHGCVRLSGAAITWLAARIVPGTPVTIRR